MTAHDGVLHEVVGGCEHALLGASLSMMSLSLRAGHPALGRFMADSSSMRCCAHE